MEIIIRVIIKIIAVIIITVLIFDLIIIRLLNALVVLKYRDGVRQDIAGFHDQVGNFSFG